MRTIPSSNNIYPAHTLENRKIETSPNKAIKEQAGPSSIITAFVTYILKRDRMTYTTMNTFQVRFATQGMGTLKSFIKVLSHVV